MHFDTPLPEAATLADALTFHAFEIESVEGDILDVKVTPNRGHDCLSHRGIAKEVAAILNIKMKRDPLREPISLEPKSDAVKVVVENQKLCPRFTGAYITGVKVGPSPEWLRKNLEAIGQKSINNIVDITNYVLFDIGQPLHAFDGGKLSEKNGSRALTVRLAKQGEKLVGLDDKEYALSPSMLVIEDANAGVIASIAGIKGGKPTGVNDSTNAIFLEAANWDGVTIRKTSQALKLRTDASDRFQQVISSELAAYGTSIAAKLITEIAGGKIVGYVDEYPKREEYKTVSVSTGKVNAVLGTKLSDADVADAFKRLDLPCKRDEVTPHRMLVAVPFERLDLVIPEDLVEEVGRIVGYDKVPATPLPSFEKKPEVNANFYAAEKAREDLMQKGYSEVFTSVFAEEGERSVLNKVGGEKPFLRTSLVSGLTEAYERNMRIKDMLGLSEVKIFEIGIVWKGGKEIIMLGIANKEGVRESPLLPQAENAYENFPLSSTERYQTFSRYPAIIRDIALWVSAHTKPEDVEKILRENAGELLVRSEKFDEFKKGERTSYAFRLVFQSFERTLTEVEVNAVMEKVAEALKAKGFEVR